MGYALIALLGVVLLVLAARAFAYAQPGQIIGLFQRIIAVVLMGLAILMVFRGALAIAVPIFLMGMGLMRVGNLGGMTFPWAQRSPGQKSTVRTSMLVMELDHDSGAIDGEVLAPPWSGRRLSDLDEQELQKLLEECRAVTDQSATLLEAYLDHAYPDWRSGEGADAGAGAGAGGAPTSSGAMTPDEARAVLGVGRDASDADVRAAHRRLMKISHPDHGGTDYLATKINQAKDVLLGKTGRGGRS
ncbi:MAG TPA: molecular chaperone DnaJ [Hyphomicrobiales bacterium]|nr:molecular chaperone DnaJ [Hyphomicrobiales bacterium]